MISQWLYGRLEELIRYRMGGGGGVRGEGDVGDGGGGIPMIQKRFFTHSLEEKKKTNKTKTRKIKQNKQQQQRKQKESKQQLVALST